MNLLYLNVLSQNYQLTDKVFFGCIILLIFFPPIIMGNFINCPKLINIIFIIIIIFILHYHSLIAIGMPVITDILVEFLPMVVTKVWHHLKSGPAALFIIHRMENVVLIRFF